MRRLELNNKSMALSMVLIYCNPHLSLFHPSVSISFSLDLFCISIQPIIGCIRAHYSLAPSTMSHRLHAFVCVCVYPRMLHQSTCFSSLIYALHQMISNPHFLLLWIYITPLSPVFRSPHSSLGIYHHTSSLTLTVTTFLIHRLCLMSVLVSGSCSAGQKQDTFPTVSVCLCVRVHFPVSLFPCVWWSDTRWQWAMVLT